MKKAHFLILALLPLTIASCDKTRTSQPSDEPSSKSESQTGDSSSQAESSTSSSPDAQQLTPFEIFKVSTTYMTTLNKIGLKGTNNAYNLSSKGTVVMTSQDSESEEPTTTAFESEEAITKASTTIALEGLKATKANDISASLKTTFDIAAKSKATEEGKADDVYEGKDVGVNAYYNSQTAYFDFSSKGFQDFISTIKINGQTSLTVPKYIKYSGTSIDETQLPISNATASDVISGLDYIYDEDNDLYDGIVNFSKTENDYLLNLHVSNTLLVFVPEIAKIYYKENNPTLTNEELTEKVKPIKDLCSKMDIHKFDINIAYNEQGYSYIDADIDLNISDYSYAQSEEDMDVTVNIEDLNMICKSRFEFQYGNDVVVAKQNSKDIYISLG